MVLFRVVALLFACLFLPAWTWADSVIVITPNGKEAKVEGFRFLRGTRTLPWLQSAEKKETPSEYLEFREEKSTTFENGIVTLVPIKSLKKVEYDTEKKTVHLVVHGSDQREIKLQGPTKFVNLNKVVVEGNISLEGVGSAHVKLQGGTVKDGLKGFRYEPTTAVASPKDAPITVIAADKEKSSHRVHHLAALYQVGKGPPRVMEKLHFKTTVKLPLNDITDFKHVATDLKKNSNEYAVTMKDGTTLNLMFLSKVDVDGQSAQFVAFVGQVDVGYKWFPLHTIAEFRREK